MSARNLSVLSLVASGCVLAACGGGGGSGGSSSGGQQSTSGLAKPGVLTTCTHLPYPPFQFEQNGKVVGFDVDIVDKAAKKLAAKQAFLDTPFENFKTGAFLNTRQCDVAAAGITITAERKKNVDFSDPYFDATQALLVRKGSDIPNLAGAKGKKIGVQTQTTGEEYAAGKGLDPTSFESSDALLNGLRTGQVDAVITDYPVVAGWLKQPALAAAFEVKDNLDTHEQYGIMVRKGNTKVVDALNAAIKESKADGSYKASYEKWIGPYLPKSTAGQGSTTPSGTTTSK
jgi:polar amino acid transport system substrate-binding protein